MTDADIEEELAQLRRLKVASLAEAATLLLLVTVAVPLKHLGGWPLGVRVMGPVHGLAFMVYLWTVIQTVSGGGWPRRQVIRLFVVAFIPLAGFLTVPLLAARAADLRAGRAT